MVNNFKRFIFVKEKKRKMVKKYYLDGSNFYVDLNQQKISICSKNEYLRYLKGLYSNKERFISRYIKPKLEKILKIEDKEFSNDVKLFFDFLVDNFDMAKPYSFIEAFKLNNAEFKAIVFSSINIVEMMDNLGAKRIKTDGIEVKHKQFDSEGNFTGYKEYHNIYEVHEINGSKLGLSENAYAVKCWCTSTNKEHFIWIDSKYKDNPLEAIASTFYVHENLIPYIKELKRQGDILLVELKEYVKPQGNLVNLTSKQYFSLLTAQS